MEAHTSIPIATGERLYGAGDFKPLWALQAVHVIQPDVNNPNVRKINMKDILYKGELKDDVDLFPGEIVVVPSTVLAKINDVLSALLSPVTRVASGAAIAGAL